MVVNKAVQVQGLGPDAGVPAFNAVVKTVHLGVGQVQVLELSALA